MKRFLAMLAIVLCMIPSIVVAHSGGTDSSGGHHDYNNASGLGSYHYHHGYGPHLHENGVCPYDEPSYDTASEYDSYANISGVSEDEFYDIVRDTVYEDPAAYDLISIDDYSSLEYDYENLKREYEALKNNTVDREDSVNDVLTGVRLTAAAGAAGCYYIYRKYNK